MFSRARPVAAAVLVALAALAHGAAALGMPDQAPTLWQESYFWDALLPARDRLARQQSDPETAPVMNAVALQIAQQVANLKQIDQYVKAQGDNLRYAYAQTDPQPSLTTISDNFVTLTAGADQVRQNLYYLTARERMASTQALPDPEMYKAGLLILGQIQQLQLTLNTLYYDVLAARGVVYQNAWANDKFFLARTENIMFSVVRVQDSVFAVYNAGYDLTIRCR
ncbi:MAG: hypothetical protein HKL90_12535 [Elusimicrobia bacterium]|nr:hypothetical protein [Elusimicrobiota bacterium]